MGVCAGESERDRQRAPCYCAAQPAISCRSMGACARTTTGDSAKQINARCENCAHVNTGTGDFASVFAHLLRVGQRAPRSRRRPSVVRAFADRDLDTTWREMKCESDRPRDTNRRQRDQPPPRANVSADRRNGRIHLSRC